MYKIHTLFRSGIAVLLFTAVVCHAQFIKGIGGNAKALEPGQTFPVELTTSASHPQAPFVANTNELALSYYNDSTTILDFPLALNIGTATMIAFGERITLPTNFGYVDSVAIRIDSVFNNDSLGKDSVQIALFKDTLYTVGGRQFHLINIFNPSPFYDTVSVQFDSTHWKKLVTARFHHVKVDKNFFVVINPASHIQNGTIIFDNVLYAACDSEAARARTADNSRSGCMLLTQQGQLFSAVFDSTFYLSSRPNYLIYTNFYTTAFVDTTGFTGVNESTQRPHDIAISNYPNPFNSSTQINIANAQAHASLKIYDALGREVGDLTQQIASSPSSQVVFNAGNLPAGIYYAKLQTGSNVVTRSLMVLK